MTNKRLFDLMYRSLLDLSSEEGINASGKEEIYGCLFGRDSTISVLKILSTHLIKQDAQLLAISRRALLSLINLQGQIINLENGEQPGKIIHEFRKRNYEHLIAKEKPWFLHEDNTIRNYDSIDSTPLTLIAIYKYWKITGDEEFIQTALPSVELGINWLLTYGDFDHDLFQEYKFDAERTHGGLQVQSWTDSTESILNVDGSFPKYPIAPVEAQAYTWLALKLWADYFADTKPLLCRKLRVYATRLKTKFNKKFILKDKNLYFAAQALDGRKNQIKTITANPLLALWANYQKGNNHESIIAEAYIEDIVKRAFKKDMFLKNAGIRTMSTTSPTYNPNQNSYHNGSFWPFLNGLIFEGLMDFGFVSEAKKLKRASLKPIKFFGSPIELYTTNEVGYLEYKNSRGQVGCKNQAWSAASILHMVAS